MASSGSQPTSMPDPSKRAALEQLSRRHSPGNVLHEFARAGVLASMPAMIAEAGEGCDASGGDRQAAGTTGYEGPVGSGHEVLLQVRLWHPQHCTSEGSLICKGTTAPADLQSLFTACVPTTLLSYYEHACWPTCCSCVVSSSRCAGALCWHLAVLT